VYTPLLGVASPGRLRVAVTNVALETLRSPPREQRRRSGRRKLLTVLALLVPLVLAVTAMATLATALSIRQHFEDGRRLLQTGQSALLEGEADRAATAFAGARQAFIEAQDEPGNILLRIEGLLPFVGRTPDALVSLSRIGAHVAGAGVDVSRGVTRLPEGLSSLGISGGRLPVDSLRTLAPHVRRARVALDAAARDASRLPDSWVIGPVGEARDLLQDRLGETVPLARSADALLSSLPLFAGQGREARYFVAAQNSAELRGTGGFMGNFAILTLDEGQMSLSSFRDIFSLPDLPAEDAPSPSRDFLDLYGPFGGGGSWSNLNLTPDAPTAATLIEQLYQRVEGEKLDGTIFMDLQGLATLLEATGPVRSKALRYTFTSQNLVKYVASVAYKNAPVPDPSREGPRLVAEAVWDRFLTATDPKKALRALVKTAANGHLVVHGTDPRVQAAFRQAGVAGEFGVGSGDFFGVAHSNAAGNKVDQFLRQELVYDVQLKEGGKGEAAAGATIINRAPEGASTSEVMGPNPDVIVDGRHLVPGEDRLWSLFYCARGCRVVRALDNGMAADLLSDRDLGLPVLDGFLEIKPARSRRMRLSLDLPRAWEGDRAMGTYRLRVQGQPAMPTLATVTVRAPQGMGIAWTSVPMQVDGGVATWRGPLNGVKDFEVRFQRGFFGRMWVRVWSFLTQPVFHV
jgi:hypothetical protein